MVDRKQQMDEFDELLKLVTFNHNQEVSRLEIALPSELPVSKTEKKEIIVKKNKGIKRKPSHYTKRIKAERGESKQTQNDVFNKVVANHTERNVRNTKSIPSGKEEVKQKEKDTFKDEGYLQSDSQNELADSKEFGTGI